MIPLPGVRFFAAGLLLAASGVAAPRVDNVLEKMTPPDVTALVGARMDALKPTELYRLLLENQKLPGMDQFAAETGFDPRRDVREILFVTTPKGSVLLARGTFRLNAAVLKGVPKTRHGVYDIWNQASANRTSGFCILDASLAAAGDVAAIEEALDEWTAGAHTGAKALLARADGVSATAPVWGVSAGTASFLTNNLPMMANGVDFTPIFRGLTDVWFEADFSGGLKAEAHGTTAQARDAQNLRDAVRGLVGLGRLSVPESQPELLRLWDGITAEQTGRAIALHIDIAQDLIRKLVEMLGSVARPAGRARADKV